MECWACLYLFKKIMFTKPQNMTHKLQFQSHSHSIIFHGSRLLADLKTKIKRRFQNQKCSNLIFHYYLCFDWGKVSFQINLVFDSCTLAYSMLMIVLKTSKFCLELLHFAQVNVYLCFPLQGKSYPFPF